MWNLVNRVDTPNSHTDLCEDVTVASHVRTQHAFGEIKMVSPLKSLQMHSNCMALLRKQSSLEKIGF